MKKIALISLFALHSIFSFSQHEPCKTMQRHRTLMQSDANYRIGFQNNQTKNHSHAKTEAVVYRIPIVIHVLHLGTAVGSGANISNEQIYSAIESLNNAYRKKAGTWEASGNGVDSEIEFCLARKDPSGQPHNGINRINASASSTYGTQGITDANELTIKSLSRWTNTKYYNIWIVSEIDNNNGSFGTQGYAYFPGASAAYDGAVMLYNAFGFDPDGSKGFNLKNYTNYNATAIHEIGHALDLLHTFEGDGSGGTCPTDADCGDNGDCVADTPPHRRSNSDCITTTNPCTGGSTSLFIHNYMDYSSEDCQNEFTAGQVARMRSTLNGGSRSQLVTNANLIACGCSGNTAPISLFTADNLHPCGATTIQFKDASLNFPISWTWSFPGGTPSTSTAQNPSVNYNGVGPYNVSLTTFSSGGQSNTLTKTSFLNGPNLPFLEDFEGASFPPVGWTYANPDADYTWEDAYASGNTSAYVACYSYNPGDGQTDDLITPLINLDINTIEDPVLSFKVSYEQDAPYVDTFDVSISIDCGTNWTSLYRKYGSDLETTTTKGPSAVPSLASHWRPEAIDLNTYMGEVIQFRFRTYNDYGADIYIDDVNVNGTILTTTITENKSTIQKPILYPNPASQQINFHNISAGTKISLVNQLGELVKTETIDENETLNIQGLSKGLYLVLIQSAGKLYTEKVVVQP
jgi:PKD repeat protein